MFGDFTLLVAGATTPLKDAFARRPNCYQIPDRPSSDRSTPNGFEVGALERRLAAIPPDARSPRWNDRFGPRPMPGRFCICERR